MYGNLLLFMTVEQAQHQMAQYAMCLRLHKHTHTHYALTDVFVLLLLLCVAHSVCQS